MNIPKLIKEAHENAKSHGFYDCPVCKGGTDPHPIHGEEDCWSCQGTNIDPSKNIGELLMLIVSELGEALEAHRKGWFSTKAYQDVFFKNFDPEKGVDLLWFENQIKDTFEDEIADVFIRLFDLCGYTGLQPFITDSMQNCHKNIGNELKVWGSQILNMPDFIEYYRKCNLDEDNRALSWLLRRMERFCQKHNIPIEKHIEAKMAYNKSRPYKHGKEY